MPGFAGGRFVRPADYLELQKVIETMGESLSDQFSGPPPCPRPCHNGDPAALKEIVKEFVVLVRLIKDAIRRSSSF